MVSIVDEAQNLETVAVALIVLSLADFFPC